MTTNEELNVNDIYNHEQLARLATLQGVAAFAKSVFGTANPGVLIELAEYVMGDDEPFDPVALAHKAREAIRAEQGYDYNGYDDTSNDWADADIDYDADIEADLDSAYVHDGLGSYYQLAPTYYQPKTEESFTVSDLAGFSTLPTTAILEDEDGDTWTYHEGQGWSWNAYDHWTPQKLFANFAPNNGEFNFVVINPEVLS